MPDTPLLDRLAVLPRLSSLPREELEWLVAHGELESLPTGAIVAAKGRRIETLWILISGQVAALADRGTGPKRVLTWRSGDVSGLLPYSRMSGPPGDNYCEEPTELLRVHQRHFPEMIVRCPQFTAHAVHLMLDRARGFNASDLQDEKMVSLGKLAAGLAHELNNPASAAMRSAKLLRASLDAAATAALALQAARPGEPALAVIEQTRQACLTDSGHAHLSPLQMADREEAIADWLTDHGLDAGLAEPLAESAATIEMMDRLAAAAPGPALDAALRWIAAGCAARAIAATVEHAATRVYELVAAVKGFSYMDDLANPEPVEVARGLRDTISMLTSKTKSKQATITLHVDEGLPRVRASGGELNQVWLNLLDNALDAVPDSGHIAVEARRSGDRVVVSVVDDGPGVPADLIGRIFDPFVTTKPPGQGTGLGLDIARRLLRRHHGEITVDSVPGRTEFRVSLPAQSGT